MNNFQGIFIFSPELNLTDLPIFAPKDFKIIVLHFDPGKKLFTTGLNNKIQNASNIIFLPLIKL